jgi:hypothetical protein
MDAHEQQPLRLPRQQRRNHLPAHGSLSRIVGEGE